MFNKKCKHCQDYGQLYIDRDGVYLYLSCYTCGYDEPLNRIGEIVARPAQSLLKANGYIRERSEASSYVA